MAGIPDQGIYIFLNSFKFLAVHTMSIILIMMTSGERFELEFLPDSRCTRIVLGVHNR